MIDMNEMMKKAQELSETMKQQQEELAKQIFSTVIEMQFFSQTLFLIISFLLEMIEI